MKKLALVSLFATVAVVVVVLIALFGTGMTKAPTQESNPPTPQASDEIAVATAEAYYLTTPPYFPDSTYKTTKVFLENATLWSNATLEENAAFSVPENNSLFVVNGTIRNDYSVSEIIELSKEGQPYCSIGLDIYLYDSQGNLVNTLNQGNPFRGCCVLTMISGEESNFKVAFASPSSEVACFEVYVSYLDPMPLF
ncbi:MAG: DUF3426 domain-containing protein [Candidatus Bathyarchaeota archaeon]|nr:DUF3426 domain-containing protein [Candidatus Bathyarchaeota archaeon]